MIGAAFPLPSLPLHDIADALLMAFGRLGGKRACWRGGAVDGGYRFPSAGSASAVAITTVSTIDAISLYWKAANGSNARRCLIRYKPAGSSTWLEAHFGKWDGRATTGDLATSAARQNEYRAMLLWLAPGTTYDVEMYVEGHGEKRAVQATTWAELDALPIGTTTTIASNSTSTLSIAAGDSGTFDGYHRYLFTGGATIDVNRGASFCIDLAEGARYIIIEGATLLDATQHGIRVQTQDDGRTDCPLIVVRNTDITAWGSEDPAEPGFARDYDSAIGSLNSGAKKVRRVVVSHCRLHHPFTNANDWGTVNGPPGTGETFHPEGPQGITFFYAGGQNVIRHTTIESDPTNYFNDGMGGIGNASFDGFPGADSRIYGMKVTHCRDDGIETEGGGQCVAVTDSFLDLVKTGLARAVVSLGPYYAAFNVTHRTQNFVTDDTRSGVGVKQQHFGSPLYGGGASYYVHNTFASTSSTAGIAQGFSDSSDPSYMEVVAKNNIITARDGAVYGGTNASNIWNYSLRTGSTYAVAGGQGANDIVGSPTYDTGHASGPWTLTSGSLGRQNGEFIPMFSKSSTPDRGAIERGQTAPVYGHTA